MSTTIIIEIKKTMNNKRTKQVTAHMLSKYNLYTLCLIVQEKWFGRTY